MLQYEEDCFGRDVRGNSLGLF